MVSVPPRTGAAERDGVPVRDDGSSGDDAGSRRRGYGALERDVVRVLAQADGPLTPGAVRDLLEDGLAYTTVMTTLRRLFDKGVVEREKSGRAFGYRLIPGPTGAEDRAAARRMVRLLDSGADRRGVLARFVADLPPDDEAALEDLLRQARRAGGDDAP
jgi:predicted transcriptional regulator